VHKDTWKRKEKRQKKYKSIWHSGGYYMLTPYSENEELKWNDEILHVCICQDGSLCCSNKLQKVI
jgi:hypothetical protein